METTTIDVSTSELEGDALDWAVARCEGPKSSASRYYDEDGLPMYREEDPAEWRPSSDWSHGGPIIEREISKIWRNMNGTFCAQIKYRAPYYSPTSGAYRGMDAFINKHGPTPLIAAMRCYVASKLGNTISIPKGLLNQYK